MKQLAPIIVFCYNRPWHTEQTLRALAQNELASESVLYIFSDGPKIDATDEQVQKIADVRKVISSISGFKEIHIQNSDTNKGLADSIIDGVTNVVNQYEKVIVLEDDIITTKGFLKFMNEALTMYLHDERVMHICAYMWPHRRWLPETFFYEVPYPGGGWATWKRAWQHYNNDTEYLYNYYKDKWDIFNKFGSNVLQKQLEENYNGTLKTWFIKWHAVMLQRDALTLYPHRSLTHNTGFDDSGSNCYSTTKFDNSKLANNIKVKRIPIRENKLAAHTIFDFYQGHWYNRRRRLKMLKQLWSFFHMIR